MCSLSQTTKVDMASGDREHGSLCKSDTAVISNYDLVIMYVPLHKCYNNNNHGKNVHNYYDYCMLQ